MTRLTILGFGLFVWHCELQPTRANVCDVRTCDANPNCSCISMKPPAGLTMDTMPQFVMLTFDDAVNEGNIHFYRELLGSGKRKNKATGCDITATFFVSAEYLNYQYVHELYTRRNEIASHSITHVPNQPYWQRLNASGWKAEIVGERDMLHHYGRIPAGDVVGMRAPFLETGGDGSHVMLRDNGFLYDASIPYRRPNRTSPPIYPYTLDYGLQTKCTIPPCPEGKYPGLWTVPMNALFAKRDFHGSPLEEPCSMADACMPVPETANATFGFLKSNFDDFYNTNKAPFPVFLHEAWLKDPERKAGYLKFVDWLLTKDDVLVVTIKEVIEFMRNPKPLKAYGSPDCSDKELPTCVPHTCVYNKTILDGQRIMHSCTACPLRYPWLNSTRG
ncbi:unnamed protein product [Ixodes persulcatus]